MSENTTKVIVTRRLPEIVEARMMELFDTKLNADDHPFSSEELVTAVDEADILVPTVTDKIDKKTLDSTKRRIKMIANFGDEIKVNMDIMISGAILIDVGKLLEYEMIDGKLGTSDYGKVVRHPFSGVAIADRFGLPPEVQHIIGTHSKEGDLGKRTVESIIVHHADFVSFEPFKA